MQLSLTKTIKNEIKAEIKQNMKFKLTDSSSKKSQKLDQLVIFSGCLKQKKAQVEYYINYQQV